ncbi:MAG: hypothetical protein HQL56_03090 [Magnetococcales bacterium]|nr:hypothetical protein [Magnetococcales bacterium]
MKIPFIATLVCLMSSGWLYADGALHPAHGGRMVEVGGHRLELVTRGERVDLYVTDHGDRAVALDKATGKVTLLGAGGKVEIGLAPAGGNRLSGTGAPAGAEQSAAVIGVDGLDKRIAARLPAGQK